MRSELFFFKEFSIDHSGCTMKVGTDAMLLGAHITEEPDSILDIGTGCGVLSLMAAQTTEAQIDAIEIDQNSCQKASENFKNSKWANRLKAMHIPLQDYFFIANKKYDLIISNPPFFINSQKSPFPKKNLSKHTDNLSYLELIKCSSNLLNSNGILSVILPYDVCEKFIGEAVTYELFCFSKTNIIPKPNKDANRCILKFSNSKKIRSEKSIILRDTNGLYSESYSKLTSIFHKTNSSPC